MTNNDEWLFWVATAVIGAILAAWFMFLYSAAHFIIKFW